MVKKVLFIVFTSFLLLGANAYAHSGRTDSNGGHNCSPKSQAKGLCSGYHYHNGGSSSSESSTSTSSKPAASSDKDCSEFATYDEVVEYWNSKGYSATYDPENLDGWGNGKVDDGIPCEAPSNYDKTKINNSPEQVQYKQEQADTKSGEENGYNQGLKDGYEESDADDSTSEGSNAYASGYSSGYNKGYEEGKKKIEAEKIKALNEGNAQGKKQDEISIPESYLKHPGLKESFESGFNQALQERIENMKKEYQSLGYKDGKKDSHSPPENVKNFFIKAYQEGYDKAQNELKQEYYDLGYEAAFTMLKYKDPNLNNAKFTQWYKDGFDSNEEIIEIQKSAHSLGENGEEYSIPSKYEKAEEIFKHYYKEGYKQYEEEQKQNQATAAGGVGIIALSWLGRRFYVARKMIR
ncbi:YHYH domain-containing protein [Cytobacillus firmus]|uniref:YHYH domain-containing protein n=1 Tax=Cytobacillus firmus TaxID=1399 RepID=UPI0021614A97|nr:YHYH domain-containing protein [Cytobacillus firmus]MCS0670433.1 YHYH domain-containing protein [Cytobacillus firmus]